MRERARAGQARIPHGAEPIQTPLLELEHAQKRYESPGETVHAVRDVSLSLQRDEFVALCGPSGSGKTTVLLLAAGLLRADAGSVRFQGSDLRTLSKGQARTYRRTELGFVFQSFNLAAGLTAQENVAIPLLMRGVAHRQAHARARSALAEVDLERRLGHTPERLSGGEQQRVAIARAIVGEPKLILADEATGNLDSATGEAVLGLLAGLPRRRGAAVILVTHDAAAARYADRVLEIRDGRLAQDPAEREAARGQGPEPARGQGWEAARRRDAACELEAAEEEAGR